MKILVCHNYYKLRGGEDQCFEDEVAQLTDSGHEVINYIRRNDDIDRNNQAAVAMSTIWSRKSHREVRKLIRDHRPDVMHCTNTFPLISPSIYYAAHEENVPVVQALHNFRLICPGAYLSRNGNVCEKCVGKIFAWPAIVHRCYRESRAGSSAVASLLSAHRLMGTWKKKIHAYYTLTEFSKSKLLNLGIEPDRIVVKHNCVHPDPGMGRGEGDYVVFAGRLSSEKGIAPLLEAWQTQSPEIRLMIIGDGPMADEVKAASDSNPMIEWVGQKPFETVLQLMGSAKAVIVPSVVFETFGRTIIEAYSAGTPAIVSKFGAMQELVRDGDTGLFFEVGNPVDLMNKVKQLLDDEPNLQRMRELARREFESKFTAQHNFQKLLDIYELAIANANGGLPERAGSSESKTEDRLPQTDSTWLPQTPPSS
ncbi:MAG: glycosyltransferase family 4 protein [Mariniblastus sp.]